MESYAFGLTEMLATNDYISIDYISIDLKAYDKPLPPLLTDKPFFYYFI